MNQDLKGYISTFIFVGFISEGEKSKCAATKEQSR